MATAWRKPECFQCSSDFHRIMGGPQRGLGVYTECRRCEKKRLEDEARERLELRARAVEDAWLQTWRDERRPGPDDEPFDLLPNPEALAEPMTQREIKFASHCLHRPVRGVQPPWVIAMCCRCYPKHIDHVRDIFVGSDPGRCPEQHDPCDCDQCSGNQCPGCGYFYKFCRCAGRDPFVKNSAR